MICYICKIEPVGPFAITPLLDTEEGMQQCCEKCANEHFPEWDEEDEDE